MAESPSQEEKTGFARRLFRAVGTAGSAVGDLAGGLIRSAGRTAKDAGGRASLTFASEADGTPALGIREIAEQFTAWLVQEHQGKADLQQQKPSTVELCELGQEGSYYLVTLDEPGMMGRTFRFVFRSKPCDDFAANLPPAEGVHSQALMLLRWPAEQVQGPKEEGVMVWDSATFLGKRNPAVDILQSWLHAEFGGTFPARRLLPAGVLKKNSSVPLFGREEEAKLFKSLVLAPSQRELASKSIISLAAPGGTGKSYFLKSLKAEVGHRVLWAGVDHQGIEDESSPVALLGHLLAKLAIQLEEQSVKMDSFGRELRTFRKRVEQEDSNEPGGFFGHLRKAAEGAAGVNPALAAVSAGVIFLTSWGQEAKEESEALAKDNMVRALTDAFKSDLRTYCEKARSEALCWSRPVIVFDTYEWLAPLVDVWMRTEFLSTDFLQDTGVCLVLAGRENLLKVDTRWSEWQHFMSNIALTAFDRSITEEYLESLGVERERHDDLFSLSEGLPLFLSLAVNIPEHDTAVGVLAKRVLEEVPKQRHEDFLKASLLDSFDRDSLKALFPQREDGEIEELMAALVAATFTVAQDGKRAFLQSVRRILSKALVLEIGQSEVDRLRNQV